MAFMVPQVERGAWFVVELADGGSDVVPADVVGDVNPETPDGLAAFLDYVEGVPESAERRECWAARLSAPGYMDCTGWTLADSEAEARAELRESFDVCPWTGDALPEDGDGGGDGCACGNCDRNTDPATVPQSIIIIGRRWFQRSAGNTYHTARVLVDGVTRWTSERCYGYGDQYLQTAAEWIYASGIIPEPEKRNGVHPPLWHYIRDTLGIAFEYWAEDVARQRDL